MKNNEDDNALAVIERLICEEEGKALARFRAGDFRDRLERSLAEKGGDSSNRLRAFVRRIPRLAWATASILFIGGCLAFLVLSRSGSAGDSVRVIGNALLKMPGFQSIGQGTITPAKSPLSSVFRPENTFAAVLGAVQGRTGESGPGEPGASVSPKKARPPYLDLQEKYRILIEEKVVERVLTLISQKTKEG